MTSPARLLWAWFLNDADKQVPDKAKTYRDLGGSPGLEVMGGDSCSKGLGFESQCCILVGHNIFYIYLL